MPAWTPHAAFQRRNCFREPDWRWQRAHFLLAAGSKAAKAQDDRETKTILAYWLAHERGPKGHRKHSLQHEFSALKKAHQFWGQTSQRRTELEACILCGQNDQELALRFGLRPEVIHWYEAAFFHVRDRLGARDWVLSQVIRHDPNRPFPKEDDDTLLKYLAYSGGPLILDIVLAVLQKRPFPDGVAPSGPAAAYAAARLRFSCQVLIQTLRAESPDELVPLAKKYHEAAKIDQKQTRVRPTLNSNLEIAMRTLKLASKKPSHPSNKRSGRSKKIPTTVASKRRAGNGLAGVEEMDSSNIL
jgi:hypothetical protein